MDDITEVMGAVVTMVTHSVYYHALVYDHDWSFIHAFATKVFRDNIADFYLKKTNVALTWLRPRHETPAKEIGREDCSELAGAAWYHGCGVKLVDDMKSKTYLSPADIYDSLYQNVVCTLKIQNGEYQLLTKQPDV